jgi:hypothetical protein
MTGKRVYRGTAERDGPVWLVRVPDVARVTQAKRLDHVEAMACELVSS